MKASRPSSTVPQPGKPAVQQVDSEKVHKTRPKHPLIGSTAPGAYPFTKLPSDFDPDTQQSLRRKDFTKDNVGEAAFFEYRAMLCDRQAKKFRARAEEAKTMTGTKEDNKMIKKVMREAASLKKLQELLSAKGVDVMALIAKAQASVEKAAEPAAAKA